MSTEPASRCGSHLQVGKSLWLLIKHLDFLTLRAWQWPVLPVPPKWGSVLFAARGFSIKMKIYWLHRTLAGLTIQVQTLAASSRLTIDTLVDRSEYFYGTVRQSEGPNITNIKLTLRNHIKENGLFCRLGKLNVKLYFLWTIFWQRHGVWKRTKYIFGINLMNHLFLPI